MRQVLLGYTGGATMAIPKFESMDLQEERLNLPENAQTCALFKLQLNLLQGVFLRDSNMIS